MIVKTKQKKSFMSPAEAHINGALSEIKPYGWKIGIKQVGAQHLMQ